MTLGELNDGKGLGFFFLFCFERERAVGRCWSKQRFPKFLTTKSPQW
jgi:hypothetical protein